MLAVILVTWNVRDLALDALRSLYADLDASGMAADVYVVDSASSDGTPDAIAAAFPQVRLTASRENLGFGKANNLAIRQVMSAPTPPDALYLLNPDTITQPGATRALYDALMANERAGLVGARLSYADGSFQHSAFAFPGLRQLWVELFPTPGRFIESGFNGRYPRALYDGGVPFPVDFVLGATMMLRREAVAQTGGFDEAFFMYCEEIDWAWRLHAAGWDVLCVPSARVIHLGGQSTGQARPRSVINLWTSRLLLAQKHYPAWKRLLARELVALGMARRQAQTDDPALIPAYRTIRRLALEGR
jgi:GT2 family glycosyltransferase